MSLSIKFSFGSRELFQLTVFKKKVILNFKVKEKSKLSEAWKHQEGPHSSGEILEVI